MKSKFENDYSPEVKEKTKKNLVWIIVFSIAMMFAGLTSGYIVSMGDNFWVKVNLPKAFLLSTLVIVLSSVTLFLAMRFAKKKDQAKLNIALVFTLLFGVMFAVFQFQGYKQLIDKGAMFNTFIIVNDGRCGDYFEIKKQGEFLQVENNTYNWKGNQLAGEDLSGLKTFMGQFLIREKNDLKGLDYGREFTLYYKGQPLALVNGQFQKVNGELLPLLDYERLGYLAQNIIDGRVDFFMSGEMGKDFQLYYKGKPLEYKNRVLMYQGKELSTNLQNKLLRGNQDTSTAYLYVITFLHLLHVIAGIIMLINLVINSFKGVYIKTANVSLKSGAIFWHFLGALWIYLLLFLTFIH